VSDYSHLPTAEHQFDIPSPKSGFLTQMKISALKKLKVSLMHIHPGAGIMIQKKVGDPVKEGEMLAQLHLPKSHCSVRLKNEIRSVFVIANHKPGFYPLIAEKIKGNF
jgi:thymidine phosphorylase